MANYNISMNTVIKDTDMITPAFKKDFEEKFGLDIQGNIIIKAVSDIDINTFAYINGRKMEFFNNVVEFTGKLSTLTFNKDITDIQIRIEV